MHIPSAVMSLVVTVAAISLSRFPLPTSAHTITKPVSSDVGYIPSVNCKITVSVCVGGSFSDNN